MNPLPTSETSPAFPVNFNYRLPVPIVVLMHRAPSTGVQLCRLPGQPQHIAERFFPISTGLEYSFDYQTSILVLVDSSFRPFRCPRRVWFYVFQSLFWWIRRLDHQAFLSAEDQTQRFNPCFGGFVV